MTDHDRDRIPVDEYRARRERLLGALDASVGLLLAGPAGAEDAPWRPDVNFEYFVGLDDEPDAALLLDPTNPDASRRVVLFLAPRNPDVERWEGARPEIDRALRERLGLERVFRTPLLPRLLRDAARRAKRLACLHPLSAHTRPVSPDLEIFRKVAERVPGTAIEDRTDLPARMRAVKSEAELGLMRRAIEITATGFDAAVRAIRPGASEFDVQEAIEHAYRTAGARRPAYGTIVGGGFNSTVLHYRANDRTLREGEVVCIDSGASFAGYAADITRTYPVSGAFTKRQREIYDLVLESEVATIEAVKPGVTLHELDRVSRAIIERAGFGDFYTHSIGHHLGLETHDINPDTPLEPGMVLTIEPGVYLPEEKIGVRIEDDVLVTDDGRRVLSDQIPKGPEEVERLVSEG